MNAATLAGTALLLGVSAAFSQESAFPRDLLEPLRAALVAAYEAGDAAAAAALYTPDGAQLPPNRPAIAGSRQIRAHCDELFASLDVRLSLEPSETIVTGGWIFERGDYTLEATPRTEGPHTTLLAKYLVICRLQPDGSWKIHWSMINRRN